jgi:hypothetical protein
MVLVRVGQDQAGTGRAVMRENPGGGGRIVDEAAIDDDPVIARYPDDDAFPSPGP